MMRVLVGQLHRGQDRAARVSAACCWRVSESALPALLILPFYACGATPGGAARWTPRRAAAPCLGVFGVALNQVFFVAGLSRTSVAHAAIIIALTPMLVLLLAAASARTHDDRQGGGHAHRA